MHSLLSNDEEYVGSINCRYFDPDECCKYIDSVPHHLSYLHLNCQGLSAKWDKFQLLLSSMNEFDFIGLSEAYHHKCDRRLHVPGYHPLMSKLRDGSNSRGGVALLVKDCFECNIRSDLSVFIPHVIESIVVECKLDRQKYMVAIVYRPNSPPHANVDCFTLHLLELLDLLDQQNCKCIVMGDMNIDLLKSHFDANISDYVDNVYARGFVSVITIPTRITPNSATLIDHIYTNTKNNNIQSGVIVTDVSDHYATFYIDHTQRPEIHEHFSRKYSQQNIGKFIDTLSRMDYSTINNSTCTQKSYDILHDKLEFAHNHSFPLQKHTTKKHKYSPWITPGIICSCKTKNKLYNKIRQKPTNSNIQQYKNYKHILDKTIRAQKSKYFMDQLTAHKNNTKETWKILHQAMGNNKVKIAPQSMKINNQIINDKASIAEHMNNYFMNISQEIQNKIPTTDKTFKEYLPPSQLSSIFIPDFTENDVILAAKHLKPKSSSGHDNISTKLLKASLHTFLTPLTHIINTYFRTGIIPLQLKQAKVITVHKSGDVQSSNNYRPISLLPAISKIFERLMFTTLSSYLESKKLFYQHQYGFRSGHSTIHPIIHFLNQIATANNSRPPHNILSIFCDLSKAFDVLDHSILLYKLSNLGIRGIAYTWLKDYLTNRTQYVSIDHKKSTTLTIKTGVPQGSILGPLLFLIYVNDIHASTSSKILSFADDTTIIVQSPNQNSLIQKANDTLSEIDTWFCSNRLFLNLNKTKFMIISPQQTTIKKDLTQLSIRDNPIDRTSSHKFLGLHIDEHLTWKTHISHL